MSVSICCQNINKSVSLFHTQFVLRLKSTKISDSWGKNISGVTYPWDFFPGGSFLWTVCPWGNYLGNKSSERQFYSGVISRGILSGGNYLSGNFIEAIIRGNHPGGNYPEVIFFGGNYPRGDFFRVLLSGGSNHPGGNCPRTYKTLLCL